MCVKCIVDSQHTTAVATYLIEKQRGWKETLNRLDDANELDEEDYKLLLPMADEMCYEGTEWMENINKWDEVIRTIAKKHSPPKHMKAHS
jgi:hypothetical protein